MIGQGLAGAELGHRGSGLFLWLSWEEPSNVGSYREDKPAQVGTFQAWEDRQGSSWDSEPPPPEATRAGMGRGQSLAPNPATLALGPQSSACRRGGHGRSCSPSEGVGPRGCRAVPTQTSPQDSQGQPSHCFSSAGPRWPFLKALKQVAGPTTQMSQGFSWRGRRRGVRLRAWANTLFAP